jgi:hypothetical protein
MKGEVPLHGKKACVGGGDTIPVILYTRTELGWVVNFTPRPLYPQEGEVMKTQINERKHFNLDR